MPKVEITIGFGSDERPDNWDQLMHIIEALQVICGAREVVPNVVDPGQITGPVQALVKDKPQDKKAAAKPAGVAMPKAKLAPQKAVPNGEDEALDEDPDSEPLDSSLSVTEQRERSMALIQQLNKANLKDEWRAIRTKLGVVKFVDVSDAQVPTLYRLTIEAAEKAGLAI